MNSKSLVITFFGLLAFLVPVAAQGQPDPHPLMPPTLEAEAISPADGSTVYVGEWDYEIDIYFGRIENAEDLFLWTPDGTMFQLTHSHEAHRAAFSPTGDRLLFVNRDSLIMMNLADHSRFTLACGGATGDGGSEYNHLSYYNAQWSPDGTMVAATATNGGGVWLEAFQTDPQVTEEARTIYVSPGEVYRFSWTETNDLQLDSGEVISLTVP